MTVYTFFFGHLDVQICFPEADIAIHARDLVPWARLLACCPQVDVLVNNADITGFENGFVAHDPEHASLGG